MQMIASLALGILPLAQQSNTVEPINLDTCNHEGLWINSDMFSACGRLDVRNCPPENYTPGVTVHAAYHRTDADRENAEFLIVHTEGRA